MVPVFVVGHGYGHGTVVAVVLLWLWSWPWYGYGYDRGMVMVMIRVVIVVMIVTMVVIGRVRATRRGANPRDVSCLFIPDHGILQYIITYHHISSHGISRLTVYSPSFGEVGVWYTSLPALNGY